MPAVPGVPEAYNASEVARAIDSVAVATERVIDKLEPHIGAGGTAHANAIAAGAAGFMTGADKTKLDGIATGANLYVHPNHSGEVTSTGDGATVIANNAVTNAKADDILVELDRTLNASRLDLIAAGALDIATGNEPLEPSKAKAAYEQALQDTARAADLRKISEAQRML